MRGAAATAAFTLSESGVLLNGSALIAAMYSGDGVSLGRITDGSPAAPSVLNESENSVESGIEDVAVEGTSPTFAKARITVLVET